MHNLVALGEEVEVSYAFVQTLKSLVSNRLEDSTNAVLRKRWTSLVSDIESSWQEGAPDIVRLFDVRIGRSGDDAGSSGGEEGEEEMRSENDEEASESEVEVVEEEPPSGQKSRKTGAAGGRSRGGDTKGKAKAVKEAGTPKAKRTRGAAAVVEFNPETDTPWLRAVRRRNF
jgi:hypothetical protein